MAINVKHKFQSAKADTQDASIVRPSNWNDTHNIESGGFLLLGRAEANQGITKEIGLGSGLNWSGGTTILTNNGGFDSASLTALFNGKVAKTGDTMSGRLIVQAMGEQYPLWVEKQNGSFGTILRLYINNNAGGTDGPRIQFLKGSNGKSWTIGEDSGTAFSISEDANEGGFGTQRMRIDAGGNFWLWNYGYLHDYVGGQADARRNQSVTQTRMDGYIEYLHSANTTATWGGYVVCMTRRNNGDSYTFGFRQPQCYIANAGWYAAFNF